MRGTSATLLGVVLLCAPLVSSAAAPEPPLSIAARSAGLARHDGFLPWYWDERKGQLLIEISKWGEPFLYSAGLSSGAGTIEASDISPRLFPDP